MFGRPFPRRGGENYSGYLSSIVRSRPAERLSHGSAQAGSYFKKIYNFSSQTN